VLTELTAHRNPEWVGEMLATTPAGDPLAHAMQEDRRLGAEAVAGADAREEAWEQTKALESARGAESLATILAGLAQHGLSGRLEKTGTPGDTPSLETGTSSDAQPPETGTSGDENRYFQ
jgi:hypothetical protein